MPGLSGPRVPPLSGGAPRQLIVLLHGIGADGDDLIALAPALAQRLPHAAFVAPNAPEPCDMAPMGYQWFSLRDQRPQALLLCIHAAAAPLDAFLDAELQRHSLSEDQLALVGFSQGTMMALYVALRRPRPIAGILGFSGALVGPERLPTELKSRPRTFLIHGDADQVVPVDALHGAVAALQAAGVPVRWEVRPGLPHAVDPEGIEHGAAFLEAAFSDSTVLGQDPEKPGQQLRGSR